MSKIVMPLIFVIFLSIMFVGGLWTQALWLITPAFCLWTPGVFWLGYAFKAAGKLSVSFVPDESTEYKRRQKTGTAYQ